MSDDHYPPESAGLPDPKPDDGLRKKLIGFAAGFGGWFVIGSVVWTVLSLFAAQGEGASLLITIFVMPILFGVNLTVLIVLAFKRRWIALGMLSALALNLVVSILIQAIFMGTCAVPVPVYALPGPSLFHG